jgi:hypothetical protein
MKPSLFNKLPCDVKCLIIDKVSQNNHKELMKELTTSKSLDRCVFCNTPCAWSMTTEYYDVVNACSILLKTFDYQIDEYPEYLNNNHDHICYRCSFPINR